MSDTTPTTDVDSEETTTTERDEQPVVTYVPRKIR